MSKQKKIVLSAVITIVMIGAIVYAFYPSIQSFAYRIVSGSLINNTDNNHTEIKPPVINNGSDNDETKPPYHSTGDENTIPTTIPNAYSEYYWEEIELGKMQDYSYVTGILKNKEQMLEEGKNRKEKSCVINVRDECDIKYTVSELIFSGSLEDIGVALTDDVKNEINEKVTLRTSHDTWLKDGYCLAAVTIEIENVGNKTALDIGTHMFAFLLIDASGARYGAQLIYGTLQPGVGGHRYYIPELKCDEKAETTAIFILPTDKQFDIYDKYIEVNPRGRGDDNPEYVKLIPINDLIN
ncbi:MAG: hypothetical protein IJA67_07965 [Oscillospiraceae bacterium]|nr:hypothetical protein [Oscillospiraceae bacterium]